MTKTISEEYKELNMEHHRRRSGWGRSGKKWLGLVSKLIDDTGSKYVLDYGAGKGILAARLKNKGFRVQEYDPAIPEKSDKPVGKFDFIVCTDVLEHVEPEYIENVLNELREYMRKGGFFTICLGPARKHILPDGRNAHVLIRSREWWMDELKKRFEVQELEGRGWEERELIVKVKPLWGYKKNI
jgi:SAM-dependent methyltransferase